MAKKARGPSGSRAAAARFAYEGLDRVIHERARLGILTSLASSARELPFNDLKELCDLTDGNLCRHLRVLEEAGLVETWKGSHHNRVQTLCRLTAGGRRQFLDYIDTLTRVIADAGAARSTRGGLEPGLA